MYIYIYIIQRLYMLSGASRMRLALKIDVLRLVSLINYVLTGIRIYPLR